MDSSLPDVLSPLPNPPPSEREREPESFSPLPQWGNSPFSPLPLPTGSERLANILPLSLSEGGGAGEGASPLRVAIVGAGGRMGQETVRAVSDAPDMELVAQIGRADSLADVLAQSRPAASVDFSVPEAVLHNTETALRLGIVPIVGATGLGPAELDRLRSLCRETGTGCLVAPNFAIGAILLMRFCRDAARFFPDAEIIEMHHARKLDAPSGTALKTAELIAEGRTDSPSPAPAGAFEKFAGARGTSAVGGVPIHSVRLPGLVASQMVIFGGPGQTLTLRHDSIDRASFMPGVLLALRRVSEFAQSGEFIYGLEHLLD